MLTNARYTIRAARCCTLLPSILPSSHSKPSNVLSSASTVFPLTSFSFFRFTPSSLPSPRPFSSFNIVVPSLGDSITEGTIAELTKREGERVEADEVVARLETDKVSMDIRSSEAGIIKGVKVKQGETVKVGDVLIEADTAAGKEGKVGKEGKEDKREEKTQRKEEGQQKAPQPQPTKMQAIDTADASHSERAHHPLIHFRYGRRDPAGAVPSSHPASHSTSAGPSPPSSFTEPRVMEVPASKASSPSSLPTSSRSQLDADAYFNVKGWQEGNEKWVGVRQGLPARYGRNVLSDVEQEVIMMGGAQPYVPKSQMKEKEKEKEGKKKK